MFSDEAFTCKTQPKFRELLPDTAPDIIMYALHLATTLGLSSVLGTAVTVCLTSRLFCGHRTVPT